MKVIAYGKADPKDADKRVKKNMEIQEERKKYPDRYPKPLSPAYLITTGRIMRLYEGTEEQFANLAARWLPEFEWEFVCIFAQSDFGEAQVRVGSREAGEMKELLKRIG